MFKSLNSIVLALIAGMVLATGAQAAGPTATTGAKATAPTATTGAQATGPVAATANTGPEDIARAIKNYRRDRSDYARDMVYLHKADEGNTMSGLNGPFVNKTSNELLNLRYTNEEMFNPERAPLEKLRDEGMAKELSNAKTSAEWAFSARTPQDFKNKYGAPAYTARRGMGSCYPEVSVFTAPLMSADIEFETYMDVDKDGNFVEIHVTTCRVVDGYAKDTSLIQSISPVMKSKNFITAFANREKKVLSHRN